MRFLVLEYKKIGGQKHQKSLQANRPASTADGEEVIKFVCSRFLVRRFLESTALLEHKSKCDEMSGYVIDCREATLWEFEQTGLLRAGCFHIVDLGDDADTTVAVSGRLSNACY